MKPLISASLLCLSLGTAVVYAAAPSTAATAAVAPVAGAKSADLSKNVEVAAVRFNNVNPPGGGAAGAWHEVEIEIKIKPEATKDSSRFVNRVRATLTLGTEVVGGAKRIEFYRATAEASSLEVGSSFIRFYLPAEIVRRDSLRGESKYYAVELSVAGQVLPMGKANYTANPTVMPSVQNFLVKALSEAPVNDGVLLPQFLTPFVNDPSRPAPAFVRHEAVPSATP
jgi:hypothetical protein